MGSKFFKISTFKKLPSSWRKDWRKKFSKPDISCNHYRTVAVGFNTSYRMFTTHNNEVTVHCYLSTELVAPRRVELCSLVEGDGAFVIVVVRGTDSHLVVRCGDTCSEVISFRGADNLP